MEEELLDLETAWPLMQKFNEEVFKQVFPHSTFLSEYYAGRKVGGFSYDGLFNDTKYKTELNQSFVHFTSLQALTSILSNGFFRFSEFRHFK